MTKQLKINVIGLGYVGLPTAAILATNGMDVVGVEVNRQTITSVNAGQAHFVEAELDTLLQAVVASGRLRATDAPQAADCFVIAVPTPLCEGSCEPDLSQVEAAAHAIATVLAPGNLVILESTSPVGTTQRVCEILAERRPDLRFPVATTTSQAGRRSMSDRESIDVHVAHCPERVMPGRMLRELIENDRIIGGMTPACAKAAQDFYRRFVRGECILTDARTAELSKLAENAYRDVNIAFANELSTICDAADVDVWELIRLANRHPRVNILQPGPGVGGHCIAVDPWFLVAKAPDEAQLTRAARQVNDAMPARVVRKILDAVGGIVRPTIACLGLAFKPDIDDLRGSPAVTVVESLAQQQVGQILAVEPYINALPPQLAQQSKVKLVALDKALQQADAVVLLVHHQAFVDLDTQRLQGKKTIDTRGVWR